jgi:hypothetical protein
MKLAMKCSPWKGIRTLDNAAVSKYRSPTSMIGCSKRCRQSRRGNNCVAHEPRELRKVREDLPVYIFSGSDDPVKQRLEGVRVLIDHYRSAGLTSVAHDFYTGPARNVAGNKSPRCNYEFDCLDFRYSRKEFVMYFEVYLAATEVKHKI